MSARPIAAAGALAVAAVAAAGSLLQHGGATATTCERISLQSEPVALMWAGKRIAVARR